MSETTQLPAEVRRQIIRDLVEVEKELSKDIGDLKVTNRDAYLSQSMQRIAGIYARKWQEAEKRAEKLVKALDDLRRFSFNSDDQFLIYVHSVANTSLSEYREGKDKEVGDV